MKGKNDWLRPKRYIHIGYPLSYSGKHDVQSYIRNKDKIAHYAFFPLIKRDIIRNHYKKVEPNGIKVKRAKTRSICYASHLDAAIYSFYAFQLSESYETFLCENHIEECVTAYRSLPSKERSGNKCNIDYAKDVFDFVSKKLADGNLAVITFDIKGFFDNLDHKLLKQAWKKIEGTESLGDDVYNVYRNVINYSYVDEDSLFDLFKDKIICKTKSGKIVHRKVKKKKFLRDKNAVAYCDRSDIAAIRKARIIRKGNFDDMNKTYTHKGIPQGLPISAVLANVYMSDFDVMIAKDIETFGGLYRRYSDDIIIVCPLKDGVFWKEYMIDQIQNVKLTIEQSKTNLYAFCKDENQQVHCKHETQGENKILEYLGFSFDGKNILIKRSGIGSYYYNMRKNVKRCLYFAIHSHSRKAFGKLFENRLVYRFTKLGSRKHKIYLRSKKEPYEFYDSRRRSLGNYWSYVKKSARIMESKAILKQMRRNQNKLRTLILQARLDTSRSIYHRMCTSISRYGRLYD